MLQAAAGLCGICRRPSRRLDSHLRLSVLMAEISCSVAAADSAAALVFKTNTRSVGVFTLAAPCVAPCRRSAFVKFALCVIFVHGEW